MDMVDEIYCNRKGVLYKKCCIITPTFPQHNLGAFVVLTYLSIIYFFVLLNAGTYWNHPIQIDIVRVPDGKKMRAIPTTFSVGHQCNILNK